MQARLKVLHDKANVKQVRLLPVTLIGRSTDCNLKIASSQVSRNHCRITLGDDAVFVEDLGSANGTLVDGQVLPAHQPTSISPGSHLVVGPAEFLVDFAGPTSPTMVLPGPQSGRTPELPTTEVIEPTTLSAAQAFSPEEQIPPLPMEPSFAEPPVVADVSASPHVAEQADVSAVGLADDHPVVAPIPSEPDLNSDDAEPVSAEAEPPASESPVVPAGFAGAEFETPADTGEFAETVQFNFQETDAAASDEAAFAASDAESQAGDAKKPGLKSLFSLFGRKEKAPQNEAPSAVATAPAAAPSVFLPTMDQQVEAEADVLEAAPPVDEAPNAEEQFSFQSPDDETTEDETASADVSAEEDDGFSQFLQQL